MSDIVFVKLEELKKHLAYRKMINECEPENLVIDGMPIPKAVLDEWEFIGLSNIDMIRSEYLNSGHVQILKVTDQPTQEREDV